MKRFALSVGAVALSLGLMVSGSVPADAAAKPAANEKARCQMVRVMVEKRVERLVEGKGISKERQEGYVEKLMVREGCK